MKPLIVSGVRSILFALAKSMPGGSHHPLPKSDNKNSEEEETTAASHQRPPTGRGEGLTRVRLRRQRIKPRMRRRRTTMAAALQMITSIHTLRMGSVEGQKHTLSGSEYGREARSQPC